MGIFQNIRELKMSRDIDNIMKEILNSQKNMETNNVGDLLNIKNSFSTLYTKIDKISQKITSLEEKIDQMFDILNTFQIMLDEEYEDIEDEEEDDLYGNKEWTPYDDDNDYEDFGDGYSSSEEDE